MKKKINPPIKMSEQRHTMLNRHVGDPVFISNGEFYFWDETWSDFYGPYISLEICDEKCKEYSRNL